MWLTSNGSTSKDHNGFTSFPMHTLRIYFILFFTNILDDKHLAISIGVMTTLTLDNILESPQFHPRLKCLTKRAPTRYSSKNSHMSLQFLCRNKTIRRASHGKTECLARYYRATISVPMSSFFKLEHQRITPYGIGEIHKSLEDKRPHKEMINKIANWKIGRSDDCKI